FRFVNDVDEGDRRRIPHRLTETQFVGVERRVILAARVTDAVMSRMKRLDDRFAGHFAASGAPGDLRQQLKRALRGAEVGETEADVRADDADQRDAREVV